MKQLISTIISLLLFGRKTRKEEAEFLGYEAFSRRTDGMNNAVTSSRTVEVQRRKMM